MGHTASVVIATYKRPEHIRECLAHLALQTVAPVRVIVVDASPDALTRDVVATFPGVEYRRNERGIGATATSRAIGISDVTEDVVAFIDDDAYAEPEWLEELLRPYEDDSVSAVGGRARNGQPDEEDEGIGQIGLLLPDGRLTGFFAADPGRDVTGRPPARREHVGSDQRCARTRRHPGLLSRNLPARGDRHRPEDAPCGDEDRLPAHRRRPTRGRRLCARTQVRRPLPVLRRAQPHRAPGHHARIPRSAPPTLSAHHCVSCRSRSGGGRAYRA